MHQCSIQEQARQGKRDPGAPDFVSRTKPFSSKDAVEVAGPLLYSNTNFCADVCPPSSCAAAIMLLRRSSAEPGLMRCADGFCCFGCVGSFGWKGGVAEASSSSSNQPVQPNVVDDRQVTTCPCSCSFFVTGSEVVSIRSACLYSTTKLALAFSVLSFSLNFSFPPVTLPTNHPQADIYVPTYYTCIISTCGSEHSCKQRET